MTSIDSPEFENMLRPSASAYDATRLTMSNYQAKIKCFAAKHDSLSILQGETPGLEEK